MESLDWSDPKKLQRRDGVEVLACGAMCGIYPDSEKYWSVTRKTPEDFPVLQTNFESGEYKYDKEPCDFDIIPRPREPRTIEAWVRPEAIGHCDTYNSWSFLLRKPKDDTIGYVRVRITEVIDE